MKVRQAFYKYNKKPLNLLISLWTWLPNLKTPWYSHVETGIIIEGEWKYFSSTMRGNSTGTRWIKAETLFKHPERWDVIEFEVPEGTDIIKRTNGIIGRGYDRAGILGFVLPFGFVNNKLKWYCSEACYFVLTGEWLKLISPRRFYSYIQKKYKDSIRRIRL